MYKRKRNEKPPPGLGGRPNGIMDNWLKGKVEAKRALLMEQRTTTVETCKTETMTTDTMDKDLREAIRLSLIEQEQREAAIQYELEMDHAQSSSNRSVQCPVCFHFIQQDTTPIEIHVNQCLNGPGQSSASSTNVAAGRDTTPDCSNRNSPVNQVEESSNLLSESFSETIKEDGPDCSNRGSPVDNNSEQSNGHVSESYSEMTNEENVPDKKGKGKQRGRPCPFYKHVQDTPFVVDAFSYGEIPACQGYFLTHFHSDHYGGLKKSWSHGRIYCSQVTANLVMQELGVNPKYVCSLPMNQECKMLDDTISVSLIDANHCPGSVLFLFQVRLPNGTLKRHLHTGDFRATPRMCLDPRIRQPENPPIDTLYLDTTYLDPQYVFPAQEEAIHAAWEIVEKTIHAQLNPTLDLGRIDRWFKAVQTVTSSTPRQPRVLIVVGTYKIGKEKVFFNIAKRLNSKIFVTDEKRRVLECLENKEMLSMLTSDAKEAQVHVLPLNHITAQNMKGYFESLKTNFTALIAFRPTGWTFKGSSVPSSDASHAYCLDRIVAPPADRTIQLNPQIVTPDIKLYGIPYSEHSSFRELAAFVGSLNIRRIIPTVNVGSERSRQAMNAFLNAWQQQKASKEPIQIVPYPAEDHW